MEEYYDGIAEGYDNLYGKEQEEKMSIIKNNIEIDKDTKILDIGCGTGISTNFDCECVGMDPSEELIKIAKNKDKNPKHKYIIEKGENINKINFKEKEFDYILCVSAVHHITNLEEFLKEVKRISKSFIVSVLKRSDRKEEIINTIKLNFNINQMIEEDKDIILFYGEL